MRNKDNLLSSLKENIEELTEYCIKEDWSGYDPYDGLNSPLFRYLFLDKNKYSRLFIIQFFKNFSINLRPIFFIKKEYNPKGLGLFLISLINIYRFTKDKKYLLHINYLTDLLLKEREKNSQKLWGYNFDWQSRAFFLKKNSPNLIVSYFVLNSFFELYNLTKEENYKNIFIDSCKILINNFFINIKGQKYFKYIINYNKLIHNVNLFGASLMSKAFLLTKEKKFLYTSEEALKTSINYQNYNGSWPYGEEQIHIWIDSFHTCYNLLSINDFIENTGIIKYENNLIRGLNFFINNFFSRNVIIKYFNNKIYPIDIHSYTAGIITLVKLARFLDNKEIILSTYGYLINEFKDKDKNFFYFRIYKLFKNKIPYIRWNQAWALYSLTILYDYLSESVNN
jgi:hypothetical protein